MASYKITFKKSVKKDLRNIDPAHLPKILRRLEELAVDPRPAGCKKLSTKDIYRVKQGSYRIVYEIMDDRLIVIVVAVGSRGSVYS